MRNILLLLLLLQISGVNSTRNVVFSSLTINNNRNASINSSIVYAYTIYRPANQMLRVTTAINNNITNSKPLLFSVEQSYSILSWHLPLELNNNNNNHHDNDNNNNNNNNIKYTTISRTLCTDDLNTTDNITIWITTSSVNNIDYTIIINIINNFTININKPIQTTLYPQQPQFYEIKFPPDSNSDTILNIEFSSKNSTCLLISTQPAECPVDDLLQTIKYRGIYLTIMGNGSFHVQKELYPSGSFYLVLITAEAMQCNTHYILLAESNNNNTNSQNTLVNIKVTVDLSISQYAKPVLILLVLLLIPCLCLCWCPIERLLLNKITLTKHIPLFFHSYPTITTITTTNNNTTTINNRNNNDSTTHLLEGSPESNNNNNNNTQNIENARDIESLTTWVGLTKDEIYENYNTINFRLDSFTRKHSYYLNRKYQFYWMTVLIVSIFYSLPALQVVIIRNSLFMSGENDLCYFNFKCAHKYELAEAFNNVWSNISYALLGVLFLIMTAIKQYNYHNHHLHGVSCYYGIYYAMGLALCSEGLMSSIYHTCPSNINFQFDSSFMFIIGALCILKLYQNRHPDISASAGTLFICLGGLVVMSALGLLVSKQEFYFTRGLYLFIVVFITLIIFLHIYFYGFLTLFYRAIRNTVVKRNFIAALRNCFCPPVNRGRILHIITILIANILPTAGLFFEKIDAASAILAFIIFNLLCYLAYYWIMKLVSCEMKKKPLVALCSFVLGLISGLFWILALVFYLQSVSDWQKTPAESRQINANCVFLNFYDNHDIWHVFSAFGLFFVFLSIITIDDNIADVPKTEIRVF